VTKFLTRYPGSPVCFPSSTIRASVGRDHFVVLMTFPDELKVIAPTSPLDTLAFET
jgi:hypothetical protein